MATNYIQEGKALNYTPSGADVASGDFLVIGAIGAVAKTDIADGKTGAVHICGVFSVAKASGAITQGAKLYWNSTNSNLTTTASGNTLVGVAAAAAASGDATVPLLLNVGL
jgi:predicted RecA/RadA family phage recombinase